MGFLADTLLVYEVYARVYGGRCCDCECSGRGSCCWSRQDGMFPNERCTGESGVNPEVAAAKSVKSRSFEKSFSLQRLSIDSEASLWLAWVVRSSRSGF